MNEFGIGAASRVLAFCTLIGASVAAQPATITVIGTGCATPEGRPAIGNIGRPVIGTTFELTYTGPNHQPILLPDSTLPHLVIGFTAFGPVAIPVGLFPLQPPGCRLHGTHDIVIPMRSDPLIRGAWASRQAIPIGNDPSLLGAVFVAQWLAVHQPCAGAGCGPVIEWIGTSEAMLCTIGR